MPDAIQQQQLEALADEIFELTNLSSRARIAGRRSGSTESLSDSEHLALLTLAQHGTLTVGEIQKAIGVLPAQMSRVIRGLEEKAGVALIRCTINPDDRRKIDVMITDDGRQALETFRQARMALTMGILSHLSQEDRDEFMRILRKMRDHLAELLRGHAD